VENEEINHALHNCINCVSCFDFRCEILSKFQFNNYMYGIRNGAIQLISDNDNCLCSITGSIVGSRIHKEERRVVIISFVPSSKSAEMNRFLIIINPQSTKISAEERRLIKKRRERFITDFGLSFRNKFSQLKNKSYEF
jgi:hypothetical protein